MKPTILNEWHKARGAQMLEFGGWEMPLQYTSLSSEHKAVRQACGLFDISHMGQLIVRGPQALGFLQRVSSNDASLLSPGRMQYSLLPAEDGSLLDDIVIGRLPEDENSYFIVVNAANAESDFDWLKDQAKSSDVAIEPMPGSCMFALQGPSSEAVLQPLTSEKLPSLGYYHLCRGELCGAPAIISRSGYTGEDGFEISLRPEDAPMAWERLIEQGKGEGLEPVGLGARNTLRLEMAYALYGHEISRETSPYEAGLGWVVKPGKGDFVGKSKIEAAKTTGRRLCGFEMTGRGVARDAYAVLDESGKKIGQVTSASPSPTLNKNIGLAYVPERLAVPGSKIFIDIRGKGVEAEIVKTPFVPSRVRKNTRV
jgi:aminomethyltransferase